MHRAARVIVFVAAFNCAAAAAQAQYSHRREGFWLGFGLGYGSSNVTCDQCGSGPRVEGVTGFLKLGGTPNPNLRLGVALNGWWHDDGVVTESMANVTTSLSVYPVAASGLFVTGGVGFSSYYVNSAPSFDGVGWGLTGGVGYDIPLGRAVSLTPVVTYMYGGVGNVNEAGVGTARTQWRQNVVDFALGVTFH